MKLRLIIILIGLITISEVLPIKAQPLNHPVIWITESERINVLDKIEKYNWARSIMNQLHNQVDKKLEQHQKNPNAILDLIPPFAKNDHHEESSNTTNLATKHNQILRIASYSGMLYFITQNERYAQLAADILTVYIDTLAARTPETTIICGDSFYDPRTTYGPFELTYDFIYKYLTKENATVYNRKAGKRIYFDNSIAQKAISNIVGNVLQEYGAPDKHGKIISNHPVLTAPGALFGILCVDDQNERERLFSVFWEKGTAHQNSFTKTILPMFGEQGIWPESTSYSFMPNVSMILNIVDRVYPKMNVTEKYKNIFTGNFLFENLRLPDGRFVRYGDSKRNNDGTQNLYLYTLNLAERRGYSQLSQEAKIALKQTYEQNGGYHPLISSSIFNNYNPLQLFWGIDIPQNTEGSIDFQKPTVIIKHAGIALQRNYVEKNNELYGLCGIIGGGHYVHSHCTGITMELYGAGYVMAPNAGLPPTVKKRKMPLHEDYFRLYAGNNTVIVNGTSHGLQEGSWKGNAYVWQNTVVNVAAEPKHLEDPISSKFNFATQFLGDSVNHCDQQRTLSTIRTSPTTAYYFDMFRSKSLDENKFQDYIYHNIGDKTQITNVQNVSLPLHATDRYKNDIGDPVHSPGWRYFENTKTTDATNEGVKVRFDIDYDNRYMHMFVPGGVEREYTESLAPPTREAKNGYVNKKTQVLAIRQQGEAWNRPFISILEPSVGENASVQSVEQLTDGSKVVGAKVISRVGTTLITDYIICQDKAGSSYTNKSLNLQFKGRFGIVRTEESNNQTWITQYIGDGEKLIFQNQELSAKKERKAIKKVIAK